MALIKNIVPRITIDADPSNGSFPRWNENVYYPIGSIVTREYQVDSDSEYAYHTYYFAKENISPLDSNPENNDKWFIFVTSDPALKTAFTDSELYNIIYQLDSEYQLYFADVDSDLQQLIFQAQPIIDVTNEINAIKHDIRELEERNIFDSLVDSDARHNQSIVWDSDADKFIFQTLPLTVNGILPDGNGNVYVQITQTLVGSRDQIPPLFSDGALFIVVGDSDSEYNGISYIYTSSSGWVRIIGFTETENDLRYVNISGDTMEGALLLHREPQLDSEAATKHYVDTFSDSDKQDKFTVLNSVSDVYAATYTQNKIYFVEGDQTLWIDLDSEHKQFKIPASSTTSPSFIEATLGAFTPSDFNIDVDTYRFSDYLPGTLSLSKNGSPLHFTLTTNLVGDSDSQGIYTNIKLSSASTQQFTINVNELFSATNSYNLVFTAHDGAVTSIQMNGGANAISFAESNRSFNYGEF